ncbi:MAG: S8/S53 family peptidase [Ktedonobacteraceae bacterium]|nr:S8/S53 family peptidase [Ktedonobacteraceae bacterium]
MRRNLVRNLLFLVAALLLIGTSLIAVHMAVRANSNQLVTLSGHSVPLIEHAQLLQPTDANQHLHLSIGLQIRNRAVLDNTLHAIDDPHSAQYHHYLTDSQFNQAFAPTPDQVQQVVSFLQNQKLTVTHIASDNLLIDATGTTAQAEQAFHVQINNYQVGKHAFYANASPPSVPLYVGQLITAISGLDNSVQYHPRALHTRQAASLHTKKLATPSGYGPQELNAAYNAVPLHSTNILGDNQTVAVFELDGYQQSDLTQYFRQYNLGTPSVTPIKVDGFDGSAGQGAIEVELDIEVIAAMAPHANQLVYEGPNSTTGLNDTYNRIVSDNKAKIVSISWGLCESSTGSAELSALNTIFAAGAAKGITFYAASGDSGAYDCNDTSLAVDSPADDPNVTGVGGTNLQLSNGAYGSESVWSNPGDTQRSPRGAGGGGGFSNTYKQPSWQTGPGTGSGNNGMREVPDVSAAADPATGYAVYCTAPASGCPSSGWITVGGTSAAAPLWAGSTALINQYLQAQSKSPAGHITPALYSLASAQQAFPPFHDITAGNNLNYMATPGYDMASGLGSPDIYNIARDLAGTNGGGSGGGTPTPGPTVMPTLAPTDTPISGPPASPTTQPGPIPPGSSLLQNGGFEKGQKGWQEASSGGYQIIDPTNPHSGSYSAYLCGYSGCSDRIWQSFTVPSSYSRITVSYWLYTDTTKSLKQCYDAISSQLQTTAGVGIRILDQNCNDAPTNGWVHRSFNVSLDLAPYKGQRVTLLFHGINSVNPSGTSDFFIDDVAVSAR